jgi:hypothetical protein
MRGVDHMIRTHTTKRQDRIQGGEEIAKLSAFRDHLMVRQED